MLYAAVTIFLAENPTAGVVALDTRNQYGTTSQELVLQAILDSPDPDIRKWARFLRRYLGTAAAVAVASQGGPVVLSFRRGEGLWQGCATSAALAGLPSASGWRQLSQTLGSEGFVMIGADDTIVANKQTAQLWGDQSPGQNVVQQAEEVLAACRQETRRDKYQKYTPRGDYDSDICGLPVTTYTGVKPEIQLNELVRAFVAGTDDAAERIAACVGERVTCTGIKLWGAHISEDEEFEQFGLLKATPPLALWLWTPGTVATTLAERPLASDR